MTRVKICGLTRLEDIAMAVDAGADAVGAIVEVPVDSPREVSPEVAAALFDGVPPFVTTVLVTMADSVERVRELVTTVKPDTVQLHGTGLDPSAVETLARTGDVDIIAAVDATDPAIEAYAESATAVLVDSTDASGAGGTGRTHDWEVTRSLNERLEAPVILAGGLTPETVGEAVETVEPYAVDVATGVEERGGIKDETAVNAFVRAAGRAG